MPACPFQGQQKGLLHFKIFAQYIGLHFPEMPLHIVRSPYFAAAPFLLLFLNQTIVSYGGSFGCHLGSAQGFSAGSAHPQPYPNAGAQQADGAANFAAGGD